MGIRSKQSKNISTSTLPQDILDEEILPRLAVKSLLKFRCVSKSWRWLIDSKRFTKIHLQNSMKNIFFPHQRVIIQSCSFWPKQCPLPPLLNGSNLDPFLSEEPTTNSPSSGSFQVVGCCNGLVCILKRPVTFIIWNPSTRMTKKLQQVSGNIEIDAFNCGFGWVESSGEYKVFAHFYDADLKKVEGRVYSSKTKSWKSIEPIYYCLQEVGVFVGEKLYYRCDGSIVFLDLKSEVFGRIETPIPHWNIYRSRKCFGVLGGCLCVVLYSISGGEVTDVWVVKDCWERVVARDRVLELLRQPSSAPSIVGPNGEISVFFRFALLVYYPQDNVFRLLKKYNRHDLCYLCIESLESPEDV